MAQTTTDSILLVEDTPSEAMLYTEYLKREPVSVTHVDTGTKALAALEASLPSVMLLDLQLPDMNGLELLDEITRRELPVSAVVITAHGSINTAVQAMQRGAADFLVKPFAADRLLVTVRNALERQRLTEIVQTFRKEFDRDHYHGFIGSSLVMQAVYKTIDAAARSSATVFVTGESGTGKEVCAEAIHRQSPRAGGPFVTLNCAAIPRELMESEIFGHVKGAFTGATSDREGAASRADGGTLFLDEICEMDFDLQAKLLRFIQTSVVQKVGGSKEQRVDTRFVCATNRDPWQEVREGRFREDLYYRLHVIPIHLPPLRDREGDVLEIASAFLEKFAAEDQRDFKGFSVDAEAAILAYPWPGNVRQLQNVIRNIVVLNEGDSVSADMLPALVDASIPPASAAPGATAFAQRPAQIPARTSQRPAAGDSEAESPIEPLWLTEKRAIERAIEACGGNIPRAAALLEISASTIYRKKVAWDDHG